MTLPDPMRGPHRLRDLTAPEQIFSSRMVDCVPSTVSAHLDRRCAPRHHDRTAWDDLACSEAAELYPRADGCWPRTVRSLLDDIAQFPDQPERMCVWTTTESRRMVGAARTRALGRCSVMMDTTGG